MSAITNSNATLPGATISSVGGQTTLPSASAADFAGDTNKLDAPDSTYPSMSIAHVAVFRAIGTPEDLLAQIAAEQPDASTLDAYIQDEIMRNPEGWDARTGQQPGTTRAGLQNLMPGQPLGGTPTTTGVAPPAVFTPSTVTGGGGIGTGTKLILGGAVAGLGVGGFFLAKRHIAKGIEAGIQALDATRVQQLGMHAPAGLGQVVGGGGTDAATSAAQLGVFQNLRMQDAVAQNMATLAMQHGDNDALQRAMLLGVIGNGREAPLDQAAAMNSVLGGLGVPDPRLSRILTAADNHGADQQAALDAAVKLALIDKIDGRAAASVLGAEHARMAGPNVPAGPAAGLSDGALDDLIARLAAVRFATQQGS